jgi:hypothetical protein
VKRWALGIVALVAAVESANALWAPGRVAGDADWINVTAEVRAGFREGDLIVIAPEWSDQLGRQYLGEMIPVEMAGRADADRYARVWEVSIRGARAPETKGLKAIHQSQHGRVHLALYEKPSVRVLFDFTSRFAQAISSGRAEPRTLEIDYRPHRGVLVPAEVKPTRIEYRDAQLGGKLVGYTGLHDYYSRKNGDGPVDFRLFVDDAKVLDVRHHNDEGWRRFEVPTTPGRHTVRFEVSAPNPSWRTFGFHAEARQ